MKEHHIALYVTVLCAGGSWKLACIIQTVVSTKTQQAAVWQQSHAEQQPSWKFAFSLRPSQPTLIPAFGMLFPCQQEIEDEQ